MAVGTLTAAGAVPGGEALEASVPASPTPTTTNDCFTLVVNLVCVEVNVDVFGFFDCGPSPLNQGTACFYEVSWRAKGSGPLPGTLEAFFTCAAALTFPFPNPDPCQENPHTCNFGALSSCTVTASARYRMQANAGVQTINCHEVSGHASAIFGNADSDEEECTAPVNG
jgi:hypothetical protein